MVVGIRGKTLDEQQNYRGGNGESRKDIQKVTRKIAS